MNWKRVRLVLAWIAGLYLAWMYFRMGWVKLEPEGFWTGAFERWGYPVWLRVGVGVVEMAGAAALLIPRSASYGAGALIAVMLGAWATRFNDGRMMDVAWITLYTVALAWIGWEFWGKRWPRRGD